MDLLSSIESIFSYEEKAMYSFHKKGYKDAFESLELIATDFLEIKKSMYENTEQSSDIVYQNITNCFIEYVKKDLDSYTGFRRFKKREAQERHNMYMVSYVFPFILKSKDEKDEKLCEAICASWSSAFKNSNIQAAPYEKILSGFQGKLFGMTVTHD